MIHYENLANSIIIQAVKDYRDALRGYSTTPHKPPEYTIKECEKFFRSQWCMVLSKVSGEEIIERLRKEYENECKISSRNRATC